MRRFHSALFILPALAALALGMPTVTAAQGINLHWNDCTLGTPATDDTDACNSNFGAPHKLIASVNPGATSITQVNGVNGVIDVLTESATLPAFWHLEAGGCRSGNLSADVGVGSANAPFSCPEPWSPANGGPGGQAGAAALVIEPDLVSSVPGANRARISFIIAVPGTVTLNPAIAPDWYIIAINMLKGGTTTCADCLTPACLVANQYRLTKPAGTPGGDLFLTTPDVNAHVTWQGGGGISCPGAVPVQNQTWGQVKHLYR